MTRGALRTAGWLAATATVALGASASPVYGQLTNHPDTVTRAAAAVTARPALADSSAVTAGPAPADSSAATASPTPADGAAVITPTTPPQLAPPGRPIILGGEFGTFFEGYGISGAQRRRPGSTARVYLRPTMSVYGKMSVDFDIMLTTEGQAFQSVRRQRLNQYSINPQWSWGKLSIGDFTDDYSPLTFNGIRVAGAGLEVRRGALTLSTIGGRTRRAAPGGAIAGTFARTLAGGRVVVGDESGTSIGLIALHASDDVGSLDLPTDTIFPEMDPDTVFVEDTLQVGIDNQFAVTPQENMVVGVNGTLSLLGDALALKGELSGSAYTRDIRSDAIDDPATLDRVPGMAQWFFTPRTSSSGDYAYTVEARVRPFTPLTTTVSFRNIGPGYVSLGSASVMSDQRDLTVRTAYRRGSLQARLDVGRQTDNLLDQKAFTSHRNRFAASVLLRPVSRWSVSARVQRATLENDAPQPEQWISYGSWLAGLRQSFAIGRRGLMRSVSLDYTYRPTDDDNPLRSMSTSRSHSVNASTMLALGPTISVTPTVGLVHSRFGADGWNTRSTYGIGAQTARLRGRWVTSVNLASSQFQQTEALQAALTSRYQMTQSDALILSARAADYGNLVSPELAFREAAASIRWAHRF